MSNTEASSFSFIPGIVSVSFRSLSPREVIQLAQNHDLRCIEWGSDIHVHANSLHRASEIRQATEDAGLFTACYGSYYRLGMQQENEPGMEEVLATAKALNAPRIRVWAGHVPSAEVSPEHHRIIVKDAKYFARRAADLGIEVVTEFHRNTLTDRGESARTLIERVGEPNFKTLWQPNPDHDTDERIASLECILPWLTNVHVFHWMRHDEIIDRRPLSEGWTYWQAYLGMIARQTRPLGQPACLLLEFVRGNDPVALGCDAVTLTHWIREIDGTRTGSGAVEHLGGAEQLFGNTQHFTSGDDLRKNHHKLCAHKVPKKC